VLRLQTNTRVLRVWPLLFSSDAAVQEIPRVALNSRFRGPNLENAPIDKLPNFSGQNQPPVVVVLQDPIVVISTRVIELWVQRFNPRSYRRGLAEVEWRTRDFR
jgi:hypothetical protein